MKSVNPINLEKILLGKAAPFYESPYCSALTLRAQIRFLFYLMRGNALLSIAALPFQI